MLKDSENTKLIIWAFERGYNLGASDMEDGIHIDADELINSLLQELTERANKDHEYFVLLNHYGTA
jgi:hypothetical protein